MPLTSGLSRAVIFDGGRITPRWPGAVSSTERKIVPSRMSVSKKRAQIG
jgi:hypothetical protein